MVESKKALPKEPRLGYGYGNPYYTGQGPMSPPGPRNFYGSGGYAMHGNYMSGGNRFYQQNHPHFQARSLRSLQNPVPFSDSFTSKLQGYYDRSSNSVERNNAGHNGDSAEFTPGNNNHSRGSNGMAHQHQLYSKYNSNENGSLFGSGSGSALSSGVIRSHKHDDHVQQQRIKQYFNDCDKQELTNIMLCGYNNQKIHHNQDGSSGGSADSYSGSGAGNYEDDFPELTVAKFSQLRLNSSGGSSHEIENGRITPPLSNVPSENFGF